MDYNFNICYIKKNEKIFENGIIEVSYWIGILFRELVVKISLIFNIDK